MRRIIVNETYFPLEIPITRKVTRPRKWDCRVLRTKSDAAPRKPHASVCNSGFSRRQNDPGSESNLIFYAIELDGRDCFGADYGPIVGFYPL